MVSRTHPDFTIEMLNQLTSRSPFGIVIFFVIFQYLFKVEFECPCQQQDNKTICVIYILLPSITLFCIAILSDMLFTRICLQFCWSQCRNRRRRRDRSREHKKYFNEMFLVSLFKAITAASIWIATAFIDGDWFVCCNSTNFEIKKTQDDKIVCDDKDLKGMKHDEAISHIIGLCILAVISIGWLLVYCSRLHSKPYYKRIYEDNLLQETDTYLREDLKQCAKDNIKSICEDHMTKLKTKISPPINQQNQPSDPQNQLVDPQNQSTDPQNQPADPQNQLADPQNLFPDPQNLFADPQNQPIDPQNQPVDAQNQPIDPQNQPVDAQNQPIDPQNQPVDAQNQPIDPQNQPVDAQNQPADAQNQPIDPQNQPVDAQNPFPDPQNQPIDTQNQADEDDEDIWSTISDPFLHLPTSTY